ncbi:MAG: hypothetical protein IID32_09030 [Planctomycetes bacterium]|nr:hypothetical protein [Planctomycetota bacterium]
MNVSSRTMAACHSQARTGFKVFTLVCMTLSLRAGVCRGIPLSFLEFQRINQVNHDLIQTGHIRVEVDVYQRRRVVDPALLAQQQQQWRKQEQAIRADPSLSAAQQEAQLKQVYPAYLRRWDREKMPETRRHVTETVRFDQGILQFRTDIRMTNSWSPDRVLRSMSFRFEGQIVRYDRDHDHLIIEYTNNKSPSTLPSRLGTIHPSQLYGIAEEDVVTRKAALEGHEVSVYDVQREHDRMVIYADPALGYRYRKIELFKEGRLAESISATDYRLFDDIALPTHHETKHFSIDKPNTPFWRRKTTRILQATALNQAIDPNVFEIAFTPTTVFQDLKLGLRYRPFAAREGPIVSSLKDIKAIIDAGIERKAMQVMAKESMPTTPLR